MQYRGKIPKTGQLQTKEAEMSCYQMRMNVEHLIKLIDSFAVAWEKELIRWKVIPVKFVNKKECFLHVENYVQNVFEFMVIII